METLREEELVEYLNLKRHENKIFYSFNDGKTTKIEKYKSGPICIEGSHANKFEENHISLEKDSQTYKAQRKRTVLLRAWPMIYFQFIVYIK